MAAAAKNDKQVMDVSKPGKTAPTPSAKPIIVGHGPIVQDPMVTTDTNPEANTAVPEVAEPELKSPSAAKKIISPLSDADKSPTEPSASDIAPDASEEAPAPEAPDVSEKETSESAVVDAVIDQVGNKKNENVVTDEDRKKQEHLDKLVAEKKYFVPLGKSHGKSSTGLVLGVLVLVAVLGSVAALDAEIIGTGIKLPFDLIKSQ